MRKKKRDAKPCPFCGSPNANWVPHGFVKNSYKIECPRCGAQTIGCGTIEEAFEAWNRRAD